MQENKLLNFRVLGNGHPVVFLHGFLESVTMWDNLHLEKEPFQSILVDLPGHGVSLLQDDSEHPSLNFMAEKVMEVLSFLKIEKYHIVGHSMGGYVALSLKELDPKCKKVVLLNSNFWEDSPEKKKDRVRVADIALKSKDLFVKEAIPGLFYRHSKTDKIVKELTNEALKMNGVSIAYSSLAMRLRMSKNLLLKNDPQDFLIIQGENDPLIEPEVMQKMLSENKLKVKVEMLKESGHMAVFEEPKETIKLISNFLK